MSSVKKKNTTGTKSTTASRIKKATLNPIPRILKPVAAVYSHESLTYTSTGVRFAFLGNPSKGHPIHDGLPTLQLKYGVVTCREDLARNLRGFVTNSPHYNTPARKMEIDTDNLRLMLNFTLHTDDGETIAEQEKALNARVKVGVRLLNFLSDNIAGWGNAKVYRLPVVTTGAASTSATSMRNFMVVAPRQWLNSSHYVSLAGLCIRLGNIGDLSRYSTEVGLISRLSEFVDKGADMQSAPSRRSQSATDIGHIANTYRFWPMLVREQASVLGVPDITNVDLRRMYSADRLDGAGGYNEGVARLVFGDTSDRELKLNMSKLKRKFIL